MYPLHTFSYETETYNGAYVVQFHAVIYLDIYKCKEFLRNDCMVFVNCFVYLLQRDALAP